MNPHLERLQSYPFERLNALKADLRPVVNSPHVALSIGEPKHAPAEFLVNALLDRERLTRGLTAYPATRGTPELRTAIATWLGKRFQLANTLDPDRHVLPLNGTREGLFSFGQAVLSGRPGATVIVPNPFYQIYEGAALLRGATPYFAHCGEDGLPDFDAIPDAVWARTELLFLCSPGNPTGAVASLANLERLVTLAAEHDFIIAADECYSEIYHDEGRPPPGLLQAAERVGIKDFRRCVVFHSLSKRSNLPGMRSGFVAGDPELLAPYYEYRTYHGCAMPQHVQEVSAMAWADELHVVANRALYRAKFDAVLSRFAKAIPVTQPAGGFYLWPRLADDDVRFAAELFEAENITVLPGSFLAREQDGHNPGSNRVRIALVAPLAECVDAVDRIAQFIERR